MKLKGKTSSLFKKEKHQTYAGPQSELEPFSSTRFSFSALSCAGRGGMSLEGLALPVIPPVSYAFHGHCWVKWEGATLAGSNCLAKGQRARSRAAKKQLQKRWYSAALVAGVPGEQGSLLSAALKSRWRTYALRWALDICVGRWYLHHLLAGWSGSLTSALSPYVRLCCLWQSTGQRVPPLPVFSSNHFGKGRQTPPPETSSQQCYFKDKLTRLKAF